MRLLEDSMVECMFVGEIKEGDLVIIDVDSEGGVIVLNGIIGLFLSIVIEVFVGIV